MRRKFGLLLCMLALSGGTAVAGAQQASAHIAGVHGPFSTQAACTVNLIYHSNAGQAKPGAGPCVANPFNFQWYWYQ